MAIKKIPVHKLKIGMFLEELDRPWLDTPFLFHRKKIKNQDQIDEFIKYGVRNVLIDTDKGLDCEDQSVLDQHEKSHLLNKQEVLPPPSSKPQEVDPVKFNEELPKAKEIKANISSVVKDMFNDVRMGKAVEVKEVKAQVSYIVDSVFRNRDALLCLANLRDYDNYTFVHSVNICILLVSFGRHLDMPRKELENIGIGGLLHDIGKTQIPESILNKPGKYNEEEYDVMKHHVSLGVEILKRHDNIPHTAILLSAQHHERYNGNGYPHRLYGEKISIYGQIGGIADVYDAITYDRVYHRGVSCHNAVKRLYEWSDTLFNRTIVERFIQSIGIYPFGSFVELNTGHCGMVVSVNHQALLKPNVLILVDKDKNRQNPLLLDLAKELDENGSYRYSIEKELDPAAWGIDINKYI